MLACCLLFQNLTYHLLESLATCKSCVIVALLANEGVPGGLEQLVEMFEVLLTGVRPEHGEVTTDRVRAGTTGMTKSLTVACYGDPLASCRTPSLHEEEDGTDLLAIGTSASSTTKNDHNVFRSCENVYHLSYCSDNNRLMSLTRVLMTNIDTTLMIDCECLCTTTML